MNLLAHYILSDRIEEVVVGNFIADFIRGNDLTPFSDGIKKGIVLHKKIDTYSDHHPVVKETWSLLNNDFGHYGRVITDIYYDHFLYHHWNEFSTYSFNDDLEYFYKCLKNQTRYFSPKLRRILSRIVAMQWPLKYTDMPGLYQVFRSISKRVVFENRFEFAVEVLQNNYKAIDDQFCRFFPDLKNFVQMQKHIQQ